MRKQIERELNKNDVSINELKQGLEEFKEFKQNNEEIWSLLVLFEESKINQFIRQKELKRKRKVFGKVPSNSRKLIKLLEN